MLWVKLYTNEAPTHQRRRRARARLHLQEVAYSPPGHLAKRGNSYRSIGDVFLVVSKHVKASQPAIKERVRAYVAMGFMEERDGGYRVSQNAIEKFKLDLRVREDPGAVELGSSLMNGVGLTTSA